MNKNKSGRKFGRKRDQRKALLKSLANSLILHEKITTTEMKAKELRRYIEPMIRRASVNSLANRRYFMQSFSKTAAKKISTEVGPRYVERKGGYTRIIKRNARKTDSARMAVIEFI